MGGNWLEMVAMVVARSAIGCFSPGHWLARRRTGEDVRDRFSGGTRARNVG